MNILFIYIGLFYRALFIYIGLFYRALCTCMGLCCRAFPICMGLFMDLAARSNPDDVLLQECSRVNI